MISIFYICYLYICNYLKKIRHIHDFFQKEILLKCINKLKIYNISNKNNIKWNFIELFLLLNSQSFGHYLFYLISFVLVIKNSHFQRFKFDKLDLM